MMALLDCFMQHAMHVAIIIVVMALSFAWSGCSGSGGDDTETGLLREVEIANAAVLSLRLETADGEERRYRVELDEDRFVAGEHLQEHVNLLLPVKVYLRDDGAMKYVYRIEDAPE